DGVAGRTFTGTVTWIASEVDARTRAVTARAEVRNPDGLLRAGQFARATVRVAVPEGAATVPMDAVQRVGDESVVFVRTAEGLYEPRIVRLGRSDGRRVQVAGEVRAGDAVVTTGAFLLRTELSRDSIGAGCCEVEGPRGN
ncbi:MAG: efflux RND transporter periplasmic adaptor subunit, partial [Phycisphaeraceae bacterium]|nr:efflux RND transporter periplasmic adaptor subunit [Phycisphaeraceae bacterium]